MEPPTSPLKTLKTSKGVEIQVPADIPYWQECLILAFLAEPRTLLEIRPHGKSFLMGVKIQFPTKEAEHRFSQVFQLDYAPQQTFHGNVYWDEYQGEAPVPRYRILDPL